MAPGPALQLTGTQILADARYWAQDQSSTNPAVSAADGLLRVNDRLVWWQLNVEPRAKTLASATTNLAFTAGQMTSVVANDLGITQILSVHLATDTTVVYPLGKPLNPTSLEKIHAAYYSGTSVFGGVVGSNTSREPTDYACELDQTQQDDWRIFLYPAPSAAVNLTIRANIVNTLSAITEVADVSAGAARVIARLVGFDMAGIQKQNDPNYLAWILSGVPNNVKDAMFGGAKSYGAQQSYLRDFGALSQ